MTDYNAVQAEVNKISTHTPLAGRDPKATEKHYGYVLISTHTPLAGRDPQFWCLEVSAEFLLTRPLRDVT